MQRHGWTLLFHDRVVDQLAELPAVAQGEVQNDRPTCGSNANVKLLGALSRLMLDVVPGEPGRPEYRQGTSLESARAHWRQATIGRRFQQFFRDDSKAKVIIYAWVKDAKAPRRRLPAPL